MKNIYFLKVSLKFGEITLMHLAINRETAKRLYIEHQLSSVLFTNNLAPQIPNFINSLDDRIYFSLNDAISQCILEISDMKEACLSKLYKLNSTKAELLELKQW